MTSHFDDLASFLQEESQPYDETTEFVCINDVSKGGLPYYDASDFNDSYIDYVYSKIDNENLLTDSENKLQAYLVPNAIYLDGDWYYARNVDPDEYSEIALILATEYKARWEQELNRECISFVFIPESFKNRKGGFHVMIFVKDNISKTVRGEIYNKIKESFADFVSDRFKTELEIKATENFKPYSPELYETLFDKGPTMSMLTLLPFAEKKGASRHYILDLSASSPCIRKKKISYLLNGILYPKPSSVTTTSQPTLARRPITAETDIDDVEDIEYNPDLEKELDEKYKLLIQKTYGYDLNIFGRKCGKLFAEFIQSLMYLSWPSHMFWDILSDHDSRLRLIFKPFIEIVSLSYFLENHKAPNEEDFVLATAKLFHPLLQSTVRGKLSDEYKRVNLQYVYNQVKIAYEKFARIPEHLKDEDRQAFMNKKYKMKRNKRKQKGNGNGDGSGSGSDDDDESEMDLQDEEELEEIKNLRKDIEMCKEGISALRLKKNKEKTSIRSTLNRDRKALNDEKKDIENDDEIKVRENEFKAEYTRLKKEMKELPEDDEEVEEIRGKLTQMIEQHEKWKKEYIIKERKRIDDKIVELEISAKEQEDSLDEKFKEEIAERNVDLNEMKEELKSLEQNSKIKENIKNQADYDAVEQFLIRCIDDWVAFVNDIIMEGMTDEIKPFVPHNRSFPYEFVDAPAQNREDCDIEHIRQKSKKDPHATSFYEEIIRTWFRHALFVHYYNSRTLDTAIYLAIFPFVKDFIYRNNDAEIDELFIYNYKQTAELEKYPYSQWIIDTIDKSKGKGAIVGKRSFQWIQNIYNDFIYPEFTSKIGRNQLFALCDLPEFCDKAVKGKHQYSIEALTLNGKLDKAISDIYNNIMRYIQNPDRRIPTEITINNEHTTFGRNGKIWFDKDGEIHYSLKDNRDTYSRGCSNIIFDEFYDYECEGYKAAKRIFETTFPVKELREYVERLIASLFVGGIHDTFAIMIGSGAEGKSVFCNLITAMLGGDGIGGKHMYEQRRNRKAEMINPAGLAADNLKSEFLLVSRGNSHDEGGRIEAKNKRFLVMQEPEKNKSTDCVIRANVVKEITSGGTTSARGIYQSSQSFVINAIPVIQTNVPPSFDTDDDAIRRRVVVIPMLAKFWTEVNSQRKNLEYAVKADDTINERVASDAYLFQGVFYYILPRITEIIKSKWIPSSQIPRPKIILDETDRIFTEATGLAGWLGTRLRPCKTSFLQMNFVIDKVIKAHERESRNKNRGLLARSKFAWDREILDQMFAKYSTKIYKLKDELYTKTESAYMEISDEVVSSIDEDLKAEGEEYVKQKYMEHFAAPDQKVSKKKRGKKQYDDLFLFGYAFDDEDDHDEDDEDD